MTKLLLILLGLCMGASACDSCHGSSKDSSTDSSQDSSILREIQDFNESSIQCNEPRLKIGSVALPFETLKENIKVLQIWPEKLMTLRSEAQALRNDTYFALGYLALESLVGCREANFLAGILDLSKNPLLSPEQKKILGRALLSKIKILTTAETTSALSSANADLFLLNKGHFITMSAQESSKISDLRLKLKSHSTQFQADSDQLQKSKDFKKFREIINEDAKNARQYTPEFLALISSLENQNSN